MAQGQPHLTTHIARRVPPVVVVRGMVVPTVDVVGLVKTRDQAQGRGKGLHRSHLFRAVLQSVQQAQAVHQDQDERQRPHPQAGGCGVGASGQGHAQIITKAACRHAHMGMADQD